MKKLTLILLAALLAVVSLVGVVSLIDRDATESELENRRLAEKPELTLAGLMDGSYISELETYYSDTFPGREALLKANQTLNKFYYFSGGEEEMLVVDFTNDVGLGGEAQNPAPDQSQPSDPGTTPTEPAEPPVSGATAAARIPLLWQRPCCTSGRNRHWPAAAAAVLSSSAAAP